MIKPTIGRKAIYHGYGKQIIEIEKVDNKRLSVISANGKEYFYNEIEILNPTTEEIANGWVEEMIQFGLSKTQMFEVIHLAKLKYKSLKL